MADIIEEIGDLVGEEDKGDIRTATRAVEISDTSSTHKITVDDLVSVEQVVSILVSENGTDYKSIYNASNNANEIVGCYQDDVTENKVTIGYIGVDNTDTYIKDLQGVKDVSGNTPAVTHVKVVVRGY